MITFFTIPKPFVGHIGVIQSNAIRSWTLLGDGVRVVLMGNEPGTAEAAEELGVEHHLHIERNRYGTPLLNSIFSSIETHSQDTYLNYINADILLLDDFLPALSTVLRRKKRFLMVGGRTDLDVNGPFDFSGPWGHELERSASAHGRPRGPVAIDYFVYRRGVWGVVPPFAVGRFSWDNWLIYRARRLCVPVIDASNRVLAIHQNHDYSHAGGAKKARTGPEAQLNLQLAGGRQNLYTIWDATHVLTGHGVVQRRHAGIQAASKVSEDSQPPRRNPGAGVGAGYGATGGPCGWPVIEMYAGRSGLAGSLERAR